MAKKFLPIFMTACMVASMTACGSSNNGPATTAAPATTTAKADNGGAETTAAGGDTQAAETTELITGAPAPEIDESELDGVKFRETRHITVEVYDRGNDGGTDPTNNMYTEYIKKGVLETHNIEVEFVKVPRWTETDELNNLLAAQTAPDICVTYSYPTIQKYADMGGVQDLSGLIEEYKGSIPNLTSWLGDANIYYDKDPSTGVLWAIEGKRNDVKRICTFVRRDWLSALGLNAPTTTQEFEDMLHAFKDRASELPVDDASKVVPFSVSTDIGWRCAPIIESFIDPNITDRDNYINGFDDRKVTEPGTKEAIRLVNKWYNDGLLPHDFALYGSGDTTEDDTIKAGYVGSFCHNWDYPFRNGEDSINANLKRLIGDDAAFVACDPFTASDGSHPKYLYSAAGDRKLFFPVTNDEPLASLLYLDWISAPEHIEYLQIGDEGVTHEKLEDGTVSLMAATGDPIMNSGNNIDYTITCNGLKLSSPELTIKSQAYGYAANDPAIVEGAIKIAMVDGISPLNVNVGAITAEADVGETLTSKRDQIYDQSVGAAADAFDSVWDEYYNDYLASGGQAIIDERTEKWEQYHGSDTMLS
ncbi:MAG: extracellular solute-binding protein [Oscillospiraceae bacterium]|nr:extracellular solute-binding protein [Oscillospiraceae bacterium]